MSQLEVHDVNNICDTTSGVNDFMSDSYFYIRPNPVVNSINVHLISPHTGPANF